MRVRNQEFLVDTSTVLKDLIEQLHENGIEYFEKPPFDSGRNIMVQCPYHGDGKERKPSAGIRKYDGLLHCFACGETVPFESLVSYVFGKDDPIGDWGFAWLKERFAISEEEDVKLIVLNEEEQAYVKEDELATYRVIHPYLKKRGIVDESIIELFDIGYDQKFKSITFPVRDLQGNCLFIARRSVNAKFFNYPKGVDKPLYGIYELKISGVKGLKDIFVCESMIDCLLLWQQGHYAVAMNGLGNRLQMKQLIELPVNHLILATDNDDSGKDARDRIRKYVDNKTFSDIIFPDGIKDIGECYDDEIRNIKNWEKFI